MKLEIGFGKKPQTVEIPDENLLGILEPNEVSVRYTGMRAVSDALSNPVGTPKLREIVKSGETVAIITSDITRPLPSRVVLPPLLDELWAAGVKPDDVVVVFALGSHRRHTTEEKRKLVGDDVFESVLCIDADSDDVVHMGKTSLGTPVDVTRIVAEADRRIGIGNIEYHYFAGYSGGAKAIMPGVSTREAIQSNHSRMVLPGARAGNLEDNPVRNDLEEAIQYCPLDFIVNVVLDEKKEIMHASAGHFIHAHRKACGFLDSLYRKEIPVRADIVIASQGGSPKDLNLYQTQKALDNAAYAVKQGGLIILVGRCDEGMGEDVFEEWMTSAPTSDSLIERIAGEFRLGGHKAAAIAMTLKNAEIFLVSELEPDFVKRIFLQPYSSVQAALDAALVKKGKDASIFVMPHAGSTLPVVKGGENVML